MAELKTIEEKVNEVISQERGKRNLVKGLGSGPLISLMYKPTLLEGIYEYIDQLEKGGFPIGHISIYADGSVWQKISEDAKGGWKEIKRKIPHYYSEQEYAANAFQKMQIAYDECSSENLKFHADFIEKIGNSLIDLGVNHPTAYLSFVKNVYYFQKDQSYVIGRIIKKELETSMKYFLKNQVQIDEGALTLENYDKEVKYIKENILNSFSEGPEKVLLFTLIDRSYSIINNSNRFKEISLFERKEDLSFEGSHREDKEYAYNNERDILNRKLRNLSDKQLTSERQKIILQREQGKITQKEKQFYLVFYDNEITARKDRGEDFSEKFRNKLPFLEDFEIVGNKGLKNAILAGYKRYLKDLKYSNLDQIVEDKEKYESALKANIDESSFWINRREETGLKILLEGRFLTQFEAGTSGGWFNPIRRAEVETQWFSFDSNIERVKDRPIYGYISNQKHGFVSENGSDTYTNVGYGGMTFKIRKSSVEDRSTFTVGDSLNHSDQLNPSSVKRPLLSSIAYDGLIRDSEEKAEKSLKDYLSKGTRFSESSYPLNFEYWELQIHKGLRLSDIEEIHIRESIWENNFSVSDQEKIKRAIEVHNLYNENIKLVIY